MAPGPARHKTNAGAAGRLADRFRHHGGGAFVAADGELDLAVEKSVERGQIAFARHAECVAHAMDRQLVDQDFAAGPRAVIAAHRIAPLAAYFGWIFGIGIGGENAVGVIRQFFCSMMLPALAFSAR